MKELLICRNVRFVHSSARTIRENADRSKESLSQELTC